MFSKPTMDTAPFVRLFHPCSHVTGGPVRHHRLPRNGLNTRSGFKKGCQGINRSNRFYRDADDVDADVDVDAGAECGMLVVVRITATTGRS